MSHFDYICSRERFTADIASHKMEILRDDGVYRHIRFKRENSSTYRFDIVTWPGFLAITGDMGENLFARLTDMFEFFRTDRIRSDCKINPGYWSEKLQCDGEREAQKEWCIDKYNSIIKRLLEEYLVDSELDDEEQAELREEVDTFLLDPEDEHSAITALRDWDNENFTIELCDFPSDKQFTFHYIWRCRAIAWAIEQYDLEKAKPQSRYTSDVESDGGEA